MDALLLFFLPSQLGTYFFAPESFVNGVRVDYLAYSLFLTDILVLGYILAHLKIFKTFSLGKLSAIAITFLLLNIAFALSPGIAAFHALKVIMLAALFYVISRSKTSTRTILISLTASTVLQIVIVIMQFASQSSLQGVLYYLGERLFTVATPGIATIAIDGREFLRPYGTFSHPNSMGGFYLLLYAFALYFKPFVQFPKLKLALIAVSAMLILSSFSKAAIIVFALISILQLFSYKKICLFCVVSRLLVLAVILTIFLTATGDPDSWSKRVYLIQSSLEIILHHWLWGVGIGNYVIAQGEIANPYPYSFLQPVHNIFLLVVTELGVVITGVIGYMIWQLRRKITFSQAQIILILVIILTGMVDHYWLTLQQNLLLAVVLFGLLQREKDMLK